MAKADQTAYAGAMAWLTWIALFLTAFLGMEAFAWIMHRYVMHGFLWSWHRSHHEPHDHPLEKNDLFAVVFAAPAIVMVAVGLHLWPWALQ
ncbi:MAG: hypothetical protein VXZ00_08460 [Pseudomonadota bacterium]|nr:hypothetical protein [Pseudomonadota bacterium]